MSMKAKTKVLIIDDDPMVRLSCRRILEEKYELHLAETGLEGLSKLTSGLFDIALIDLKLPDVGGMEILSKAPDRFPGVPLVIITGYSTIKSAVEAVKMGAFDYIEKPFTPDDLEVAVEKALRQRRLLKNYHELQQTLSDRDKVFHLIGDSPAIQNVYSLIDQVAGTESTVLIAGESGTGKELVARAIHHSSPRSDARFIAVDCGAIAPNLIAGELFGHVKGAFTGATSDRVGLVQTADSGTLFLDEISNLALDLQASLLRVIEAREVRAVGASTAVPVDVRYIAATNQDLQALVNDGKFREDLFYRLNVFPIFIPPLRERREDIPALARHFLRMFAARMHKRIDDFTEDALEGLLHYDWPGNVRELSNVIERLVILCPEGRIGRAHLRNPLTPPAAAAIPRNAAGLNDMKRTLRDQATADIEKAFLREALRRNDFNVTRAAEETGMQRSNFQALLKKHGLRIRDIVSR